MSSEDRAPLRDPFLEGQHLDLAARVRAFGEQRLRAQGPDDSDSAGRTLELVRLLADAQLLGAAVPPPHGFLDLRSLVVVREALAYFSGLADAAFAAQGLGAHPIALAGTDVQKARWLPAATRGDVLCAFAATEPEAGSDLDALRTRAEPDGVLWRLTGTKTLIANAGIAGVYTVLARSSEAEGRHGLSVFLVDAASQGIAVKPLQWLAPHPLGEVRFDATPALLLGTLGGGWEIARATLDALRPSEGAAACGLAARALDEALRWSLARRVSGHTLAAQQATQIALAEMRTDLTAARLMVHRAAWLGDGGAERSGADGALALLAAAGAAQRVVDRAVQIHGGHGLLRGATVERLYREVRSLRLRLGSTEVLKLEVAQDMIETSR